jgi:hypothetical protein
MTRHGVIRGRLIYPLPSLRKWKGEGEMSCARQQAREDRPQIAIEARSFQPTSFLRQWQQLGVSGIIVAEGAIGFAPFTGWLCLIALHDLSEVTD